MGRIGVLMVYGGLRGFMGVYGGLWWFMGVYGGRVGVFDGFLKERCGNLRNRGGDGGVGG